MSMSAAPRVVRGGLVVLDPDSGAILRTVVLQYNPDTLTRSFQVQGVGGDGGADRAQPFRLKGPAIESIKLEAEIDATDALERPDEHATAVAYGIGPQLALLEGLVNPTSADLQALGALSQSGTLEILPPEAPLTLFVWGANRVAPVRVTDVSIVEESFDPALNPMRAKVNLGLRVMTTDDLGFVRRGGAMFLNYLRSREALAGRTGATSVQTLGLTGLP